MLAAQRNPKIDIIKGIGICLMVLGHCGSPITHFLYLFHMPIFFIASGYVFNRTYTENIDGMKNMLLKRIKGLWIPFAFFSVIYVLLWNFFVNIHIYDADLKTSHEIIRGIFKVFIFSGEGGSMAGAFWFLRTLFFTTIGYGIVDFLFNKIHVRNKSVFHILFAIIIFAIAYIMSIKQISLKGLDLVFAAYPMFVFGAEYRIQKLPELNNTNSIVVLSASLLILLVCHDAGGVEMSKRIYTSPWFYIVSSVSGWFFLYSISTLITKSNRLTNCFSYLGKNTICIIVLHFLVFKIINLLQIEIYELPIDKLSAFPVLKAKPFWWVLYSVIGICIPLLLNWCYDKVKSKIVNHWSKKTR